MSRCGSYHCCWHLYAFYVCVIFLSSPGPAIGVEDDIKLQPSEKPNIVIIIMDDLGFNDVSFHGSNQVVTSNIDALAYNGIILNKLYVPNLCTPSRASLLTGKYPIHTGMQHSVIINDEPWGLPLEERLMPEIFRDAGYSTSLVGKWHLGFFRKEMTPLHRGFDHHFGYYSGLIGYYDHTFKMLDKNYTGLDMRRDVKPLPEVTGTYATDLFTQEAVDVIQSHNVSKPLFLVVSHLAVHAGNEDKRMEAPEEEIEKFSYISDPQRRIYAAMLSCLDESIGQTVKALADKAMLDNTIILLYSDNGAPNFGIYGNGGSNFPFKGQKASPWEGGIRSAGLLWSPLLNQTNYVSQQVIHAIDWLPTLSSAAGVALPKNLKIDGINLWPALSNGQTPQPRRLLHAFDNILDISSYMRENLKYVNGSAAGGRYDTWMGVLNQTERDPLSLNYEDSILNTLVNEKLGTKALTKELIGKLREQATLQCPYNIESAQQETHICEPLKAPCYFDLDQDPCERYNLANLYPLELQLLAKEVEAYRIDMVPSARRPGDPLANPLRFGGNWQWWYGTEKSEA